MTSRCLIANSIFKRQLYTFNEIKLLKELKKKITILDASVVKVVRISTCYVLFIYYIFFKFYFSINRINLSHTNRNSIVINPPRLNCIGIKYENKNMIKAPSNLSYNFFFHVFQFKSLLYLILNQQK